MITLKINRIGFHARELIERLHNQAIRDINLMHDEKDLITGLRIYFINGSMLEIIQNTEPVDDEDEHKENPLDIEYQEGDKM